MQIQLGLGSPPGAWAPSGCAVTIGNFDGVHRGHQAMLAVLLGAARRRGLQSCVLSFEPHPRDFFATRTGQPELAPRRIATLRDKAIELARCGVDRCVLLRFDQRLAGLSPQDFIRHVLIDGLDARYVLVGDDFRFGARRAGDYAQLDAAGQAHGFEVARMSSFEVHGLRVSSSAVREALGRGDLAQTQTLIGRPYAISGHVVRGRRLGRELGFPTLNLRFGHPRPAAQGIFVARVHGLTPASLPAVASLGVRPTIEDAGRVLLEAHCLDWPFGRELPAAAAAEHAYGRCVQVELLHKLHDELRYESLDALRAGIKADRDAALAWLAADAAHRAAPSDRAE